MIRQAIAAAREDMLIRELLQRAELREMCLQALRGQAGPPESAPAPRRSLSAVPDAPEADR